MKALLIDVNFTTGERAGDINPRKNKNMPCNPLWQHNPIDGLGKELRLVLDENVDPYRGVEGIEVLENEAEIEAALEANFPEKEVYRVSDADLKRISIEEAVASGTLDRTKLSESAGQDEQVRLKALHEQGIDGIEKRVRRRPSVREVSWNPAAGRHERL